MCAASPRADRYGALMAHHDPSPDPSAESGNQVPASRIYEHVDDVPAARLLAHDVEPLTWDHDGDGALPPPD